MKDAQDVSTAPIVAVGLIGGFLTARETGIRPLGGVVLAAAGAYAARTWFQKQGWPTATALTLGYLGGFGASHPLAKKIGAWPAVFTVAGASALAAHFAVDSADSSD
ncbi:hypothetical protein [Brevibacterium sp. ZH18]|uniref:hypothetical protein n=1 Tax=Brevibacterium sp. ZH18 TaxID=2927784 RepID=UPI001F60DFD0|nr:hypothetical protein [Brevibacterium sp. ZH18]MCI4011420.1 hypothetical protein [Brevibacterium sp. ZH18]